MPATTEPGRDLREWGFLCYRQEVPPMSPDEAENLHEPDEEGFIPGIYNFCDRWCERCPHTRRCRSFAMGRDLDAQVNLRTEAERKAFWDSLDGVFLAAREKLTQVSFGGEDEGLGDFVAEPFDDGPSEEEGAHRARRERRGKAADAHPLVREAKAYFEAVRPWLEKSAEKLRGALDEIVQAARLELPTRSPAAELKQLQEWCEVVSWYHAFIYVKTRRVVGDLLREDEDEEDAEDEILREAAEYEMHGTAKVTLLALDRSLGAWARLLEKLPEEEAAILPLLARLDRLRKGLESAVPKARAFIRPGLDSRPAG